MNISLKEEQEERVFLEADGSKSGSMLSVRLPDVPPEAFQLVLTYIYTDCIDPTDSDTNHKREPGSNQIVLLMMQVGRDIISNGTEMLIIFI